MKSKKGITLISLVITIVVLIILAGVTINLSLGENGLFKKAKTATEQYTNAQSEEEMEIANYSNEIDSYVGSTRGNAKIKRQVVESIEYSISNNGEKQIDIRNVPNYDKLSKDDFHIEIKTLVVYLNGQGTATVNNDGVTFSIKEYKDGILTIDLPKHVRNLYGAYAVLNLDIVVYYIDYE